MPKKSLKINSNSLKEENWILIDVKPDGRILHFNKSKNFKSVNLKNLKDKSYENFIDEFVNKAYLKEVKRLIKEVLNNKLQSIEFFSELNALPDNLVLFQIKASALPEFALTILISNDKNKKIYKNKINEAKLRSMRVIDYANLVIVRISPDFTITDILGNSNKILGLKKREIQNNKNIWQKLFGVKQSRELLVKLKNSSNIYTEISSEVLLKTKVNNQQNWILLRATPLYSRYGEFLGWEGFGIDISDKKNAETSLLTQNVRIKALYEVSKVLHEQKHDPAYIALMGMNSLIQATDSHSGFIAFFNEKNKTIEVIASKGLSLNYLRAIQNIFRQDELITSVIKKSKQLVISDTSKLNSSLKKLYETEKIISCILTPLVKTKGAKDGRNGVIAIFKKNKLSFSSLDYDVVSIASKQISLVLTQAQFIQREKEELDNQATLYELSRELALPLPLNELLSKSYSIINSKFKIKSLLFGKVESDSNEITSLSFLVDSKKSNLKLDRISLSGSSNIITDSFRKKKLKIIKAHKFSEFAELKNLYLERNSRSLVLLPLISLGKVIGLLILEPAIDEILQYKNKVNFLRGVANEIATVLLSKHFEAKLAESEKMKLAGLLSSGVAHNFNNILQAVLGQASIIELNSKDNKVLSNSSKEIISAVNRGADIIKQMLSFSDSSIIRRKRLNVVSFIYEEIKKIKERNLNISFKTDLKLDPLFIKADTFQLKQLISNLVSNSIEALSETKEPLIDISIKLVEVGGDYLNQELSAGKYCLITVKDNGKGMTEDELENCFQPFYTSKKHANADVGFDGSGLGLAFSLAIARQHKGTLSVKSSKGLGASFFLYIPLLEKNDSDRLDHETKNKHNGRFKQDIY